MCLSLRVECQDDCVCRLGRTGLVSDNVVTLQKKGGEGQECCMRRQFPDQEKGWL